MYKFILLVAIFVAGCQAQCMVSTIFECFLGKIDEIEDLKANKTTLCSDLDSVYECEQSKGCGQFSSGAEAMCNEASCSIKEAVQCALVYSAQADMILGGVIPNWMNKDDCFVNRRCIDEASYKNPASVICIENNFVSLY